MLIQRLESYVLLLVFGVFAACNLNGTPEGPVAEDCTYVEEGFGPEGTVEVRAEEVVSGLEVPWGILFLEEGDMLVTERPGRIRLVEDGELVPDPVATVEAVDAGEGGLLDIAPHPDFGENRLFYLYYTVDDEGTSINRVERWMLSEDRRSASSDQVILDDIPASQFHNGGRMHVGPDGMLYIGTGDAQEPDLSQDPESLAGKLLRVTPDGAVPDDNPFPDNPAYLTGIRNTQGFDWPTENLVWMVDHGPSGELGRTGHDEVHVGQAGDNFGWPDVFGCETQEGMLAPALAWREAVPPGGAAMYSGTAIPEWQGDLLVGTLGSEHVHRVVFDEIDPAVVDQHEVYFQGELGRLRSMLMGPDGELYVTTSNCDGRGTCPEQQDQILRITR